MDIAPLEELTEAVRRSDVYLFSVKPALVYEPRKLEIAHNPRSFRAPNPPVGAGISYYLRSAPENPATLTIVDGTGQTIATFAGAKEAGFHRAPWDLRSGADKTLVEPGSYVATLEVDGKRLKQKFEVRKSP